MRVYVASSWRNQIQPQVVSELRALGHDVYDFRDPPQRSAFSWEQIAADWRTWTTAQYRAALEHPLALSGYASDIGALRACDACVLVLPCGRSANFELGFAMGMGKRGVVLQLEREEPELMYREAEILATIEELRAAFATARWLEIDAFRCPFCDSIKLEFCGDTHVKEGTPGAELFVICRNCKCVGPAGATVQQAFERWNQRRKSGCLQYVDVEVSP